MGVSEEDEELAVAAFETMVDAEVARLEVDADDTYELDRALEELAAAAADLNVDIDSQLSRLEDLREVIPAQSPSDSAWRTYRRTEERSADGDDADLALLFGSLK